MAYEEHDDVAKLYLDLGVKNPFKTEAERAAQKRETSAENRLHLARATSAAASNSKKSMPKNIIKSMMSGMFSVASKISPSPSSTPKGSSASKPKGQGRS